MIQCTPTICKPHAHTLCCNICPYMHFICAWLVHLTYWQTCNCSICSYIHNHIYIYIYWVYICIYIYIYHFIYIYLIYLSLYIHIYIYVFIYNIYIHVCNYDEVRTNFGYWVQVDLCSYCACGDIGWASRALCAWQTQNQFVHMLHMLHMLHMMHMLHMLHMLYMFLHSISIPFLCD